MSIEGPGIAVNDAVPFDDALGVIPHPVVPLFRVRSTMVPIARPGALAYDYADPLGFRALGEADVFHLRAFGSDGLRGLSPLKFARQTVSAALAADEVSNKLFANGVRPSGVLQMDQVLKPDQRKDLRENVIAPLAGSGYPPQEPTGSRLHRMPPPVAASPDLCRSRQ